MGRIPTKADQIADLAKDMTPEEVALVAARLINDALPTYGPAAETFFYSLWTGFSDDVRELIAGRVEDDPDISGDDDDDDDDESFIEEIEHLMDDILLGNSGIIAPPSIN